MTDQLVLIFIKNPVVGKVKTRLAKSIGAEKALDVYHQLLAHTADITRDLDSDKAVFYSDFVDESDAWDAAHYQKFRQTGDDLGERMQQAFAWAFAQNYRRVVIIGSDCPELTNDHIRQAFQALDQSDVVIGPARDGGYYLLGMRQLHAELFAGKTWSTYQVFADTLADVKRLHLSCTLLEKLSDIDEAGDLPLLQKISKNNNLL